MNLQNEVIDLQEEVVQVKSDLLKEKEISSANSRMKEMMISELKEQNSRLSRQIGESDKKERDLSEQLIKTREMLEKRR